MSTHRLSDKQVTAFRNHIQSIIDQTVECPTPYRLPDINENLRSDVELLSCELGQARNRLMQIQAIIKSTLKPSEEASSVTEQLPRDDMARQKEIVTRNQAKNFRRSLGLRE